MRKFLSICIVIIFTTSLFAQKRNLEQAKRVAYEYLNNNEHIQRMSFTQGKLVYKAFENVNQIVGNSNNVPFYILVDSLIPSSYVIVSGDERMKSVLAYGDNGKWEEKNIPDGLFFLLENYRNQYEQLQSGEISKKTVPSNISIPNVEPMIKTTWRQEYPFNALCPNDCPSGCVATAMSQVMKYHQFPSSGIGSFSYTSHTRKYRCSYDFSSATFECNKMKNCYGTSTFGS